MAAENSIDDFLNHKTSTSTFATYFKWRGENTGDANVWLHTKCMPVPVWRHQIPLLKPIEDKDTKETHIMLWSEQAVCWEDEDVLRSQHARDDNGTRKKPPQKCGLCRLIEWVYQQVQDKKIDWKETLFVFKGENKDKESGEYTDAKTVLHAAGLYNGFSKVEDDDEKKELKEAGIYLKNAWKENMLARCNYIFRVVDNASPKDGVQIAIEAALLGDKVKTVISDRMTSKGRDAGNPMLHPYAIKWKFNNKEKEFQKKYHALIMDELPLTATIKDLIFSDSPPKIDHLREPFTQESVRSFFERHCVYKGIPWDKLFIKGTSSSKSTTAAAEAEKASNGKSKAKEEPKEEKQSKPKGKVYTTSTGIEIAEDDVVACDKCEKPMNVKWTKCVECGTTYQGEGLVDPPEVIRRRSAVAGGGAKKKPEPVEEKDDEEEDDDTPGDGEVDPDAIPF